MGTGLRRPVELVGVWTSLGMRDGVPLFWCWLPAGCLDLAVFLQAPSPPVAWVGGFLFSFLGSVLELMTVESQRGLGFGMRMQGL